MTHKTTKRVLLTLVMLGFVVFFVISWTLYPQISNLNSEYITASVIRDLDAFVTAHPGEWPKSWQDLGDGSDRSPYTKFRFDLSHDAVLHESGLIHQAVTPIRGVYYTYPHAKAQLEEVLKKMQKKHHITEPNQNVESANDSAIGLMTYLATPANIWPVTLT